MKIIKGVKTPIIYEGIIILQLEIKKIEDCDRFVMDVIQGWAINEWGPEALNCFDGSFEIFVSHDNGWPIGCGLLSTEDLPSRNELTPWLSNLFIKEEYRGRGIGTQLIKFILDEAKKLGFPKVWLYTDNEKTLSLYTKLGWRFVESTIYHGKPALIMDRVFNKTDYNTSFFDIQTGSECLTRVIGVNPKIVTTQYAYPLEAANSSLI